MYIYMYDIIYMFALTILTVAVSDLFESHEYIHTYIYIYVSDKP